MGECLCVRGLDLISIPPKREERSSPSVFLNKILSPTVRQIPSSLAVFCVVYWKGNRWVVHSGFAVTTFNRVVVALKETLLISGSVLSFLTKRREEYFNYGIACLALPQVYVRDEDVGSEVFPFPMVGLGSGFGASRTRVGLMEGHGNSPAYRSSLLGRQSPYLSGARDSRRRTAGCSSHIQGRSSW